MPLKLNSKEMDSSCDSDSSELKNAILDSSWPENLPSTLNLPSMEEPISIILRSKCLRDCCPFGKGIFFKSRISPSPSKSRLRSRRRRLTDQPAESLDESAATNTEIANLTIKTPKEQRKLKKKLNYTIESVTQSSSMTEPENVDLEKEIFVPASQFFSDSETPEKLTSDYFSGSDTPSKLRESTRRLSVRKPYSSYIAYSSDEELEEWWQEPKTDYTYSVSLSYRDRVTPERRIGSPNMSRRALRHSGNYSFATSDSKILDLRSRSILKRSLDAFSDGSDGEEPPIVRSKSRLDKDTTTSTTRNISVSQSSILGTTTESVDYGLDDSDSDNAISNSLSHVAKPLVRRGRSSLMRSSAPLQSNLYSAPSDSVNGITNIRMANHVSKTQVYTTTSTNGNNVHSHNRHLQNGVLKFSWQERLSAWLSLSWTTMYTVTCVLFTSFLIWTKSFIDYVKKLKSYCVKRDQSSSKLDVSVNNLNSDRKNLSVRAKSSESSNYLQTVIMSRTQTVVTTTQTFYSLYQEKRRNSPILWGWLPILLLLLLFLPFCAFWLRQPSESLGATTSSYSSRSWHSIIPSTIIQALTDFVQWLNVVFWTFTSLMWSLIAYISSNIYHSLKFVWVGFRNLHNDIFGTRADSLVIPSTEKGDTVNTSLENAWYYSPAAFVSQPINAVGRGFYGIFTYGQASICYITTCLMDLLLSLWNFAVWLCLGLWSKISFGATSFGSIITSIFSCIMMGIYSVVGAVIGFFKLFLPHGSNNIEAMDFSYVKVPDEIPKTTVQSQSINDEVLIKLFHSPQLLQFLSSSLDESLRKKGISKEEIDAVIKSSISSELDSLSHGLLEKEETNYNHILLLKNQQEKLLQQIKDMELTISAVKFSYKEESEMAINTKISIEDMISKISADILKLNRQLDELQRSHESLKFEVQSCCHSTSLNINDVENHVNLLLSDIFGFNLKDDAVNLLDSFNTSLFGASLGSYFVAKGELENKLKGFMDNIKSNVESRIDNNENTLVETVQQTTQIVMKDVIENIRNEIHLQQKLMQQQLNEVVDSSKSEQETFLNLIARQKETLETSIQEAQTKEATIALLEEAFSIGLPDNIASLITKEIDLALKKHRTEQADISEQLNDAVEEKFNSGFNQIIENKVSEIFKKYSFTSEDSSDNAYLGVVPAISRFSEGSFNETVILQIVNKALSKYDADKTGMVDHALESAGGTIVSTRCTEGYQGHQAELTMFGYPIYRYSVNTPRSIIQPDRMPGQCYAFKGSQGFIVIHFAGPVKVTAFSLEHIPKALSPTGTIDSAPKEFSVFGLQTPNEGGYHLGDYVFKDNGEPLQYFPVVNYTGEHFEYVELKVNSNHGNIHYTCIYRFRVHGVRQF